MILENVQLVWKYGQNSLWAFYSDLQIDVLFNIRQRASIELILTCDVAYDLLLTIKTDNVAVKNSHQKLKVPSLSNYKVNPASGTTWVNVLLRYYQRSDCFNNLKLSNDKYFGLSDLANIGMIELDGFVGYILMRLPAIARYEDGDLPLQFISRIDYIGPLYDGRILNFYFLKV